MTTAVAEHAAHAALDETYARVPIGQIHPSKTNPRTHFDTDYLAELAGSIREKGVLEPILLRPLKKGQAFEIVAGECRYRASVIAELTHLPAVIREYSDEQVLEIQIEENTHRKDLTPLEEAAAYRRLITANPDKHSAATIAQRIGMSVTYVWDYLSLLNLIAEAKSILERKLMTVGHAILIARLKSGDQSRAIDPDNGRGFGPRMHGLWRDDHGRLDISTREEEIEEEKAEKKDKYYGLKACSVRELDTWIRNHIRFDVEHAAKAQPLAFEPVAETVRAAVEQPGRGKKMIPITHEYRVADDARDADGERTYGSQSWERADGKEKSKTCEHSVLGVVVAGRGQGSTLQVCVARDKCVVHFAQVVKAKQKAAKLREAGENKKASKVDATAAKKEAAREKAEQAKRAENERTAKAWQKLEPLLVEDAVAQVKGAKSVSAAAAKLLSDIDLYDGIDLAVKHLGKSWFKTPAAAWMVIAAADWYQESYDDYITKVAKPLGLNLKRLEAIRDKHQPKDAAAPAKKAS